MLNKINRLRRRLMRGLTKNIGNFYTPPTPILNPADTIHVLISRPNHRLGNLLLITPLLEEVTRTFPNAKIDLFVKGDLPFYLFAEYPSVNRIIQLPRKPFKHLKEYLKTWLFLRKTRYDLVINVDRGSSSGTLSTSFAHSEYKIFGEHLQDSPVITTDRKHIAKNPVYAFREFLMQAGISTRAPIPCLNLKLNGSELSVGKKIVEELVPDPHRRTICLFTYATGEKCYPREWWEDFYKILNDNFQDYNFIEVLPIEKVSNLSFRIPYFYSRDVRELASVIANTCIFIGADSGIMHLASSGQIPTVGLFSVTNEHRYCPYGKQSLAINTNTTNHKASLGIIKRILDKPPKGLHSFDGSPENMNFQIQGSNLWVEEGAE